jgi:hypothetical protein
MLIILPLQSTYKLDITPVIKIYARKHNSLLLFLIKTLQFYIKITVRILENGGIQ